MAGPDAHVEQWPDEDPDDHDDDTEPYWFPGQHLPGHARGMGLTHHTQEGALLDFAGSLDPSKPLHKITAWVMLVVFGLPVFFYVLRLVLAVLPG
ncbi:MULTISPECIES: hypothetical protein [Nocardioides]|jgi:hypothetical protein|uniref:hypothetical protein n=1 Tax=Nocardioides TaxID=1839 RepID=UPI00187A6B3C|nr:MULTISPECIES: hypothetical protein [Nocardioides]MCM3515562.1 hypothetical protein [Nocardioides sp. P86]